MLSVNTNIQSINAQRNIDTTQASLGVSMQRLSSGLRINSAKDDAAGMAISDRMTAQIRGMNVGMRNANDAISLAATAEGTLGKVTDSLQRMRELAVQSANVTNSADDRLNLNAEFQELGKEITRVLADTKFNGLNILAGNAGILTFQVGAGSADTIAITTVNMSANANVTAVTGGGITNVVDAGTAMDNVDAALIAIAQERANYGGYQNRFESVISNLQVSIENQTAARGRITDADFATETANLSRAQILQQAGMAMLSQANQAPQQVLSLLR